MESAGTPVCVRRRVVTAILGGAFLVLLTPAVGSSGGEVPIDEPIELSCIVGASLDTQHFTVPAGVGSVTIDAFGAQGGAALDPGGPTTPGGLGGSVHAVIPVQPGDVINVLVGCQGEDAPQGEARGGVGGTGFGGDGGDTDSLGFGGGGGGGQTRIMLNGTSVGNIVAVAGGGGGAGSGPSGGAGGDGGGGPGLAGGAGTVGPNSGGGGGGQPGCTGGTGFNLVGGGCLTLGGGAGAGENFELVYGGGGGGGGSQGGGGGGESNADLGPSAGGGGGGSSIVNAPASAVSLVRLASVRTQAGVQPGNGRAVLTFSAGGGAVLPLDGAVPVPLGGSVAPIQALPRTTG